MDKQTIEQIHKQATELILARRLKEALTLMSSQHIEQTDWDITPMLHNAVTTYDYMLRYMAQGISDPERDKLHRSLLLQALHIADMQRVSALQALPSGAGYYSFEARDRIQRRKQETRSGQTGEEKEAGLRTLFDSIMADFCWDGDRSTEAHDMLSSGSMPANALCLMVSAVTLSALSCYDRAKVLWLLAACRHHSDGRIALRALTGIVILAHIYQERMTLDSELCNMIGFLDEEVEDLSHKLSLIYMQLLHCQDTDNVNRKMRDTIIPEMVKASRNLHNLNLDDDADDGDDTPAWNDTSRKTMEQMQEMQQSGDDINIGTFSQLKHFSWFNEAFAWLYPFDESTSVMTRVTDSGLLASFPLHSVTATDYFCDSDKYSFTLMLAGLMETQRKAFLDQLPQSTIDALNAMKEDFAVDAFEDRYIVRSYLQDLYRFFMVSRFRIAPRNIFSERTDLHRNALLKPFLCTAASLMPIAEYRFRQNRYSDAHDIYRDIMVTGTAGADIYRHDGFCLQKDGRYDEARKAYEEADRMHHGDAWTLRHLATCCRRAGDMQGALACYRELERLLPQDTKIAMQTGRCLLETGRYEEALQYFYKAELADENNINACRAIAWCSFMLDKEKQATLYSGKVLAAPEAQASDYLNAGHICWWRRQTEVAVANYGKAYSLYNSTDDFRNAFLADTDTLKAHGINEDDIPLMLDIACSV